ncbi:MAG: metal ABC transporter permease [Bdellovibrionaceae bacterium]|nr:metal ABC transporter permease [Pseudobdellovibrionaceae bacterium]
MQAWSSIFQNYDLYINALFASLLIGYASAPIGVFLNLKRMTLMGEAISHSLLPGFALAFMLYGMSYSGLILGGLFAGLLVLGLMMGLNRFVTIKEDGVLTVIYLTFSALGILIVLNSGIKIDLSHILIGNILLIDQVWLSILFVSSLLIRLIFHRIKRDLLIVLMDPEYAQFLGVSIQKTRSIFYFLVLWILVLCFYSVGTLLALGLLLIPALIAKVLVRTIDAQIKFSLYLGILMSFLGLMISVTLDWPTGPTIILTGGALFVIAVFARSSGLKFTVFLLPLLLFRPCAEAAIFTNLQPRDQVLLSNSSIKLFVNHLVKPSDKISMEILIPNDQSTHNYQLKPSDMKKIKRAKVFLYIGNGLEEGLKDQVAKVNSEIQFVNLTSDGKVATTQDVHFWLNPEWAIPILSTLKASLVAESPMTKPLIESRFRDAQTQIAEYTKHIQDTFLGIKSKTVLISHNSLYFLRNFLGIDIRFYMNSTSPSDVMNLKKMLKDKNITLLKEYGSVNFLLESMMREHQRSFSGEVYGEIIPAELYESKSYLDLLKLNVEIIHSILKSPQH